MEFPTLTPEEAFAILKKMRPNAVKLHKSPPQSPTDWVYELPDGTLESFVNATKIDWPDCIDFISKNTMKRISPRDVIYHIGSRCRVVGYLSTVVGTFDGQIAIRRDGWCSLQMHNCVEVFTNE